MDIAIKHPVPDRVKPSSVIFDIRSLWRSALSARVTGCQKLQMTGLTRNGTGCSHSCAHMAIMGVKGLSCSDCDSIDKTRLQTQTDRQTDLWLLVGLSGGGTVTCGTEIERHILHTHTRTNGHFIICSLLSDGMSWWLSGYGVGLPT